MINSLHTVLNFMFASVEIYSLVIIKQMYYSHLSSDFVIVLFEMEILVLSYRN